MVKAADLTAYTESARVIAGAAGSEHRTFRARSSVTGMRPRLRFDGAVVMRKASMSWHPGMVVLQGLGADCLCWQCRLVVVQLEGVSRKHFPQRPQWFQYYSDDEKMMRLQIEVNLPKGISLRTGSGKAQLKH